MRGQLIWRAYEISRRGFRKVLLLDLLENVALTVLHVHLMQDSIYYRVRNRNCPPLLL